MGDWTGTVPTFVVGKLAAEDMDTMADIATGLVTDFTSYTPTLTNLTLGGGTVAAAYRRLGKTMDLVFKFTLGAGSAVAAGPAFSLPGGATFSSYYGTNLDPIGNVMLTDTGTANRGGFVLADNTNDRVALWAYDVNGVLVTITNLVPHMWAATDVISVQATFQIT